MNAPTDMPRLKGYRFPRQIIAYTRGEGRNSRMRGEVRSAVSTKAADLTSFIQ